MMNKVCTASLRTKQHETTSGFTLIEMLISMFVTAIVGGAIVSNYIVQQRAATRVRQVAHMQQQIRGAITVMSEDIRLAGLNRDPDDPDSPFGIRDIRNQPLQDENGEPLSDDSEDSDTPSILLTYDYDRLRPNIEDNSRYDSKDGLDLGPPTTMNGRFDEPYYEYRLFNEDNDGTLELARYVYVASTSDPEDRQIVGERQLLSENIEAIAFAYAIDADEDGLLDLIPNRPAFIWAVDTDGDGDLDTNLDTDGNGFITEEDAGDNNIIESGDNGFGALPNPVDKSYIRAVKIWLLACTGPVQGYADTNKYVIGDRIYRPEEGDLPVNRRRMRMEHIVNCRNMWPTKHM